MEAWIVVLSIIVIVLVICLFIMIIADSENNISKCIFSIIIILLLSGIISHSVKIIRTSIKPIDVYRNKTELKITSINGEPIDSVVVYKNEIK